MCGVFMKYLPSHLKNLLENDLKQFNDIPELTEPFINVSTVLQAHYILAHYFTDESAPVEIERMLVGVRSYDLLCSALCRQITSFAGHFKYTDKYDLCATLFYGLVKNHAFHDGNKRTALLILLYQLSIFGYYPRQEMKKFESLVLSVAEGSLQEKYKYVYKKFKKFEDSEIKTISYNLRQLTEKKNTQYHLNLSMKEFCDKLKDLGVECILDNNKIKLLRTSKGLMRKKYSYTINFYGWTRVVEAKMARDTLDNLGLTKEFASIKNLFDGKPSFYKLISQFEVPLRRLKDE